jgi:hypothetical protein
VVEINEGNRKRYVGTHSREAEARAVGADETREHRNRPLDLEPRVNVKQTANPPHAEQPWRAWLNIDVLQVPLGCFATRPRPAPRSRAG